MQLENLRDLCNYLGADYSEPGSPCPNGWRPEGGWDPNVKPGYHPATPVEAIALSSRSLARRIYKDTSAGCPVRWDAEDQTLTVYPYCEGSDGLDCHEGYAVTLPCDSERIGAALEAAETDSQAEWDATHGCEQCWDGENVCDDWGNEAGPEDYGMRPVDPACKSCQGGIVI